MGGNRSKQTICVINTVIKQAQRSDGMPNLDLEKDLDVYPREIKI